MAICLGSSPHPRGTPVGIDLHDLDPGIIPASAGNTGSRTSGRNLRRDHPRIRGEHQKTREGGILEMGSSPHPRGTLLQPGSAWPGGIIPASAGNTLRLFVSSNHLQDHPRIRGEHGEKTDTPGGRKGSSPHPRGTPSCRQGFRDISGIIPASAGNTLPP